MVVQESLYSIVHYEHRTPACMYVRTSTYIWLAAAAAVCDVPVRSRCSGFISWPTDGRSYPIASDRKVSFSQMVPIYNSLSFSLYFDQLNRSTLVELLLLQIYLCRRNKRNERERGREKRERKIRRKVRNIFPWISRYYITLLS